MGKVTLARIDERLIHGQVMTNLSQNSDANSIFIVDDEIAKDEFMKQVFVNSGSRTGMTIKIYSVKKCSRYWELRKFDDFNCILLTKTVDSMYRLVKNGIPIKALNIGGIAKRPNTEFVISSVSIDAKMAAQLREIKESTGADVYFQTIQSSKKVSLEDGIKTFDKVKP